VSVVDVILVNWNDRENLRTSLASVFALPEVIADPGFAHVVVSDNGSRDRSVDEVRRLYGDRVAIIENGENLGFAAGVNRALAQTYAPFAFLLNPDATLHAGALRALVDFMIAHPRCAVAGPKIFEANGRVAESCGEFDTWVSAFLRSSAWGEVPMLFRFANGATLRGWNYDTQRRVDLLIGAALLLRRAALDDVGVFDERYFMYHEEVDLAKRLAAAGYESWFVPQAQATHIGQGSSGGRNVERYKQRSRRRYWVKHHGHVWYYTLSAALLGRYVLYAGALAGIAVAARRFWVR